MLAAYGPLELLGASESPSRHHRWTKGALLLSTAASKVSWGLGMLSEPSGVNTLFKDLLRFAI